MIIEKIIRVLDKMKMIKLITKVEVIIGTIEF